MKPLYMWAGGKTRMIPKYLDCPGIPLSGYDTYVEPFFGGGAMMLYVYQNNPEIKKFVLNDINQEIVGIYSAIKSNVTSFMDRMNDLEAKFLSLCKEDRKKFYYALRSEYTTNWNKWNETECSATLYFLMKTGFNGIWQTNKTSNGRFATPSGLLNQKTEVYDKHTVMEWNKLLQKVDIFCGDWKACTSIIEGRALYFLDPPYRDSFTSYGQVFNDTQQLECVQFCKKMNAEGHLVMLCNRDCGDGFFTNNIGDLNIFYYDVTYTAGRRKQTKDPSGNLISYDAKPAKEVLLTNYKSSTLWD